MDNKVTLEKSIADYDGYKSALKVHNADIETLKAQLAERDALIAKKDEALEFYANRSHWVCDEDLKHSTIGAGDAYEMAEKALALKVKKGE